MPISMISPLTSKGQSATDGQWYLRATQNDATLSAAAADGGSNREDALKPAAPLEVDHLRTTGNACFQDQSGGKVEAARA